MSNTPNEKRKAAPNEELAGELLEINLGFFDRLLSKFDQISAQNSMGMESQLGFEALARFVMTAKATAAQKKQLDERISELEELLGQAKRKHEAQDLEKRGLFERIKLLEESLRKQEGVIQKNQTDHQNERLSRQAHFEKLEKQAIGQLERSAERLKELMHKNDILRKELQSIQVQRLEEQTEHRERVEGLEERLKASEANVSQLKSELRFMEKRLREDLGIKDAALVQATSAVSQLTQQEHLRLEQLRQLQIQRQSEAGASHKKMNSIMAAVGNERKRAELLQEQLNQVQKQLTVYVEQEAKWQADCQKAEDSRLKCARTEAVMAQQKVEIEQLRHLNDSLKNLLKQNTKKPPLPVVLPKINLETPEIDLSFSSSPALPDQEAHSTSLNMDWGKEGKC